MSNTPMGCLVIGLLMLKDSAPLKALCNCAAVPSVTNMHRLVLVVVVRGLRLLHCVTGLAGLD